MLTIRKITAVIKKHSFKYTKKRVLKMCKILTNEKSEYSTINNFMTIIYDMSTILKDGSLDKEISDALVESIGKFKRFQFWRVADVIYSLPKLDIYDIGQVERISDEISTAMSNSCTKDVRLKGGELIDALHLQWSSWINMDRDLEREYEAFKKAFLALESMFKYMTERAE